MARRLLAALRLPRLAADPNTAVSGWFYFNTTTSTVRWYNGSVWADA